MPKNLIKLALVRQAQEARKCNLNTRKDRMCKKQHENSVNANLEMVIFCESQEFP